MVNNNQSKVAIMENGITPKTDIVLIILRNN
jgi:hypothetical protein